MKTFLPVDEEDDQDAAQDWQAPKDGKDLKDGTDKRPQDDMFEDAKEQKAKYDEINNRLRLFAQKNNIPKILKKTK